MNIDEVRQIILNILKDIAPDEDISSIDDNTKLRDQIDLDSMDFLDYLDYLCYLCYYLHIILRQDINPTTRHKSYDKT